MDPKLFSITTVISLFVLFASIAKAVDFDLQKYGAQSNGDITQAMANAWKDACASPSSSKIIIPKGTYKLTEAKLLGPCKAPIEINLQATLQIPDGPGNGDSWITLERIDMLNLNGGGVLDGKGESAWGKIQGCAIGHYCKNLPMNLRLNFVTNSIIRDITSLNSKQFHTNVLGCNNVTFDNYTITAPAESLNTDGIHLGRSTNIIITNSNIGTGDDCISIGDGSKDISITKVTCGPGHGISVGSLGKFEGEEPVQGITVTGCTFKNTDNGIRVKTWPDSFPGEVSNLHYEDITMDNVSNPIVIDQEYCPWNKCNLQTPSKVKISNISIKNVHGTSNTATAIKLSCSPGTPCDKVELGDIDLTYSGNQGPITSTCKNIKPITSGKQNPAQCLTTA